MTTTLDVRIEPIMRQLFPPKARHERLERLRLKKKQRLVGSLFREGGRENNEWGERETENSKPVSETNGTKAESVRGNAGLKQRADKRKANKGNVRGSRGRRYGVTKSVTCRE
jgi:hypothetical protein